MSALGMGDYVDEHPASSTRGDSVSERRDWEPWKAGSMGKPEQKKGAWMKDSAEKFPKELTLMMDYCTGTCTTVETCMLFDHHRQFAGWDLDLVILSPAETALLPTFASQVLNSNSDVTGDRKVRAAAPRFKKRAAVVSACRRTTTREATFGLGTTQVKPGQILHFPSTLYEKYELYEKCLHSPLDIWF